MGFPIQTGLLNLLLTAIGGGFWQSWKISLRDTGMYWISHFEKTGEFCKLINKATYLNFELSYLQNVECDVAERAANVKVESDLRSAHIGNCLLVDLVKLIDPLFENNLTDFIE